MKRTLKILAVVAICFASTFVSAQKLGHLNFAELYSMMPEQAVAEQEYTIFAGELQTSLETMQLELQQKFQDYQANLTTMSDIIKQNKEQEIQDLQQRIEAFQYTAQESMQQKELELMTPIIEKAQEAVKAVAEESGYSYVFNTAEGLVLYATPTEDIMSLVIAKLGIAVD